MPIRVIYIILWLAGCGGGGEHPIDESTPAYFVGSMAYASGALSWYGIDSTLHSVSPGPVIFGRGTLRHWQGNASGDTSTATTPLLTELRKISGTCVDPIHDVTAAFDYQDTRTALLRVRDTTRLSIFNTGDIATAQTLNFGGAKGVYTAGCIMDIGAQRLIAATSGGFVILDYQNPVVPTHVRTIPSMQSDSAMGVEIIEHFAYHPALITNGAARAVIFTGGNYQNRTGQALVLVDSKEGTVYRPDLETSALLVTDQYIDSIALDIQYNVALLADEGIGLTWVDLNQLVLDPSQGRYSLPAAAVWRDTALTNVTQIAVVPGRHIALLATGSPAKNFMVGEIESPATRLGFSRHTPLLSMPNMVTPSGLSRAWVGAADPHGVSALALGAQTVGAWLNDRGNVLAIFDLEMILTHAGNDINFNPATTTPAALNYVQFP